MKTHDIRELFDGTDPKVRDSVLRDALATDDGPLEFDELYVDYGGEAGGA